MGSQVLAEIVADCLKRMIDEDKQKKWYALIQEFFPLIPGPCYTAHMEQHRRIKGEIHRELDVLCSERGESSELSSLVSVNDNDVSKVMSLPSSSLIIQERWLEKIYNGQKTWELRSKTTLKRGRIGLISSGSGVISGEAWLSDCFCLRDVDSSGEYKLTHGSLEGSFEKHRCTAEEINTYCEGRVYAWVLEKVTKYETSYPYQHPQGAVIWVRTS